MRLLQRSNDGEASLTDDFGDEDEIPTYAILSHTWGADGDEVTFEDLREGTGKAKLGYEKIRFCGEQAQHDNLKYFWIDTCCIDKTDKAELSKAIQSMFRWYRNAARCYVFLPDVSSPLIRTDLEANPPLWESQFRKSKWFTRGWTLQELLAPNSVEFFSRDKRRLGDKKSLREQIHKITNIPRAAIDGAPISQFTVNERLLWKEHRETKHEEDGAYSLLGIFDVYLAPLYGEGAAGAFRRLMDEIQKQEICVQDIRNTDPRDDKKRIEDTKGGLLKDSYFWVLENASFQQWHTDPQSKLLWIKGDPGKGKTMLLCGIINELQKMAATSTACVSYFFCQATDSGINSATAVLRGLLYLIVIQQPASISHVRKKHDHAGKSLFEDANAWINLIEIFADVLRDPNLSTTYLVIDALDECVTDMLKLLNFIAKHSSASSRVKWIVSSRNSPGIEEQLERTGQKVRLSLELNAESVSAAVGIFIKQKVLQLAQQKNYDVQTQDIVLERLTSKANNTFLWVALVCQDLQATARRNVLKKLDLFPPGLDALYKRMMQQISKSDDAELCQQVLATIVLAFRPLTLQELVGLAEQLQDMTDETELREIIGLCGSFLTLQGDTIYFTHQSVKDFLLAQAVREVFPSGTEVVHHAMFVRSLQTLSKSLRRDMYGLQELGKPIEDVEQPDHDPLAASRYSCVYWINHLCDSNLMSSRVCPDILQDKGILHTFLREKYLYWLEALSLCRSMPQGVVSMAKLQSLVQGKGESTSFTELIYDAYRFVMYHKGAIESSPLQVYASALLFSPRGSLIKKLFQHEEPVGIIIKPAMDDYWSACLQTLEGHNNRVRSVAFSHDSTRLASGSDDRTIKVWEVGSGACLQTLEGHDDSVRSVAFSHNSTQLASASCDNSIKIWDVLSGTCLQTLRSHSNYVNSVVFSHNSTYLASASDDKTTKIWDTLSGTCLQTLKSHVDYVNSVAFSHDSSHLASASYDNTIKIWKWDAGSEECLRTLQGHRSYVNSVVFSHNATHLASASNDRTAKIWDASSGACLRTLEGHSNAVNSVAFSHDSVRLASASYDYTVKIWDADSGVCLHTLEGHSSVVAVVFSYDSTLLASASHDKTAKIWDAGSRVCLDTLRSHDDYVNAVAFSRDSTCLASVSNDSTIKTWDAGSGVCLFTLRGHSDFVRAVAFSHDSTLIASASDDGTIKIWDAASEACLRTLEGHSNAVNSIVFSHDSAQLASASYDYTVKIWDTGSGACLHNLRGHTDFANSVSFSYDSTYVASASNDSTVRIWDVGSGACLQIINNDHWVMSVAFSLDSVRLASALDDKTVNIWDIRSGACLQSFSVGKRLLSLSFDPTGSRLCTEIGTFAISTTEDSNLLSIAKPEHSQCWGAGVGSDMNWITNSGKNILWVPSEYRGSCSSVCGYGRTVGIGVGSGRVWMCSIDPQNIM